MTASAARDDARSATTVPMIVGRVRQRALLTHWLDDAVRGRPGVVLVSGEAGLGKSALARWTIERGRRMGFSTLVGVAQRDLNVPYLAMASALAPIATAIGESPANGALAWPVAARGDPDQLRLFLGVMERLAIAARRKPTLLVLDDLHWADVPSVELFTYLVSCLSLAGDDEAGSLPVLILATTRLGRDEEQTERVMGRLRREPVVSELHLPPLDELEVNELVAATAGARSSRRVARYVLQSSGGVPLLVESVVQELLESGVAELVDDQIRLRRSPPSGPLVLDVDDAVGRRVDKVGGPCVELLIIAATLGDDRPLAELATVAGLADDQLVDLVEQAEEAHLIDVSDDRYRFVHPQVREMLLSRGGRGRRHRLHLEIANQIDAGSLADGPERVLRLADHLERAGPLCPPDRLARAARQAGEQAMALAAWATAAHAFNLALGVDASELWTANERATIHLRAATASFRDHDLEASAQQCEAAIELARAGGDTSLWGTAALVLARAHVNSNIVDPTRAADLRALETFLDEAPAVAPDQRASGLALEAEAAFSEFDIDRGLLCSAEARRLADEAGDDATSSAVDFAEGLQRLARLELDVAAERFASSAEFARRSDDPLRVVWGSGRLPLVRLAEGHLVEAEAAAMKAAELARAQTDWAELALAVSCRCAIASAQGRFRDAVELGESATLMIHRSDYLDAALILYPSLALARAALGDGEAANATLDELDRLTGVVGARYRTLVALLLGDVMAAERWSTSATWRKGVDATPTIYNVSAAVAAVELGVAIGDTRLTNSGRRVLRGAFEAGLAWCIEWPTSVRRVLGLAAGALGADVDAEELLIAAAAEADAAGSVWERARTALVRGSWAARSGREMDATVAFSEAIGAFEACAAFDSAARARHLATTLGVSLAAPATAQALRVIMMTDIVGSTAINHRLGDEAYLEVLRIHNRLTRHWLRQCRGIELRQTGDGFNAWFADASAAVRCAIDLQRDFEHWRADKPDLSVQIRCGLAAGRPLSHEQDLFGMALSEASRLCALAPGGGTLASDAVRELVGDGEGVRFESAGELELKGFPGLRPAFKVSSGLS